MATFFSRVLWYLLFGLILSVSLDKYDHDWFEKVMVESNPRYYKLVPWLVYICMYIVITALWPLALFCWFIDKRDEKGGKNGRTSD